MAERYILHNGIIRNFAPPNGNILHKTNWGLRIKALYLHVVIIIPQLTPIVSESTIFIQ